MDPEDPWGTRREFLEEVLLATFEQRQLQTQAVTAMPLYPTEAILWDDNQVPDMHYTGTTLDLETSPDMVNELMGGVAVYAAQDSHAPGPHLSHLC